MIYDLKKILDIGEENGFAVPAFNVYNLETVMGVMQAAEETGAPAVAIEMPDGTIPRGLPSGSRRGCSRGSAGVPLRRDGRYDRRFQKAPGREHCNHQGRCGDGRGNEHRRRG